MNRVSAGAWMAAGLMPVIVCSVVAQPLQFSPDNFLVTANGQMHEYTCAGDLVQTIDVPYPGGDRGTFEWIRDVTVLEDGRIAVFNGGFNPYLSILDPANGDWSHTTIPGWSAGAVIPFSSMATLGSKIFLTDSPTSGSGAPAGFISYDYETDTFVRIEGLIGQSWVGVGLDDKLYAEYPFTSTREIFTFDPDSLAPTGSIVLDRFRGFRGITATREGEIILTANDGLWKFGTDGFPIDYAFIDDQWLQDTELSPDGDLVFAGMNGVYVTDSDFNSPQLLIPFSDDDVARVALLTNIPEPSSVAGLLAMLLIRRR
jgi:hypothetical protein